jgi:hypothetical protein
MGPLRAGLDEAGLEGLLRAAIQTKPERHLVNEGIIPNLRLADRPGSPGKCGQA